MVTRALPQLDIIKGNKALGSPTKATIDHQFMVAWMAVLNFVWKPVGSWIWGQINHKDVSQISIC